VTFSSDFLFASLARGGNGAIGGFGILGLGGRDSDEGNRRGGGLSVQMEAAVDLYSSTVFGNAAGGSAGLGGLGFLDQFGNPGIGPNGDVGIGLDGGIFAPPIASQQVAKSADIIVRANSADADSVFSGFIRTC
jgi:hypothetical protein